MVFDFLDVFSGHMDKVGMFSDALELGVITFKTVRRAIFLLGIPY
jgi:hypothetical protein